MATSSKPARHRGEGGALGDVGDVGRLVALDVGRRRDGVVRADQPSDPPPGHGVGLGHPVRHQAPLGQLGHHHGHRVVLRTGVDEVLVDLVGEHPQTVLDRPATDRLDLLARVDRTGWVRRRYEEQRLGPRRAGRLEVFDRAAEPRGLVGVHKHRHPAGQHDRFGVGGPKRGHDDDFVARVAQHREGVGHGLLAPVGDQHLGGGHRQARVAPRLGRDRLFERGDACGRGVVVVGRITAGLDRGLDDVGRGREVRLTGTEANDVLAGRLERLGFGIDGQGGRWGHRGGAAGNPAMFGLGG